MNSRSFVLIGLSLFLLTLVVPILVLKFGTNPQNPTAAEMEACCFPIPLAILSFLFIAVGITRYINERIDKTSPRIVPPED